MTNFESPQLFSTSADALSLSGKALLELMQAVLAREIPFRFTARGWSMTPFIHDADVITIEPIKGPRLYLGQVVAFIQPESGNLVVHRIVGLKGDRALIVGDNIPDNPDGIVPLQNILGCVTRIERDHQRVWLGLGLERFLIAWLSRVKLLIPLRAQFEAWQRRIMRRN